MPSLDRAMRFAADPRSLYIVINVAVNVIFLVRSVITMFLLDYRGLGLIALLQTIILLIVSLQFGFLQGGYRLLCGADESEGQRINNLLYSFVAALSLVSFAVLAVVAGLQGGTDYMLLGLFGLIGGIFTLVKNWMTSAMIAREQLAAVNRFNCWSGFSALAMFAIAPWDPLIAALLATVAPPVVYAAMAWVQLPDSRPSGVEYSLELTRSVLRAGFILFLTGIFTQLNVQVERWYVAGDLGIEALGHLYLVILYLTIFQLVPNSFDAIFLPRAVRSHQRGDHGDVGRSMRYLFLVSASYTVVAMAATLLLAEPIIAWMLPKYAGDLPYLYALLPGLAFITLCQPLALIFNVLINYRYYLIAYAMGTALTILLFGGALLAHSPLGLTEVVEVRALGLGVTGAILLFGFWQLSRRYTEFRFRLIGSAVAT
jgi:O-antigen/teichoic acid export membrane protein